MVTDIVTGTATMVASGVAMVTGGLCTGISSFFQLSLERENGGLHGIYFFIQLNDKLIQLCVCEYVCACVYVCVWCVCMCVCVCVVCVSGVSVREYTTQSHMTVSCECGMWCITILSSLYLQVTFLV